MTTPGHATRLRLWTHQFTSAVAGAVARPVVGALPVLPTAMQAADVRAAGVLAPAVAGPGSFGRPRARRADRGAAGRAGRCGGGGGGGH